MDLKLKKIIAIQVVLLIALLLVIGSRANAAEIDCEKHQVYCHIVKNKPKINKQYAMKLSNIIYKKAKKYGVNPFLYSGIIAQESYYDLEAMNCIYGMKVIEGELTKEVKICTDFGLSQIHYRTAKRYNFDVDKLTTDLEYSVEAGMKVLKDFQKRYKHKEFNWWSRYNSSTPTKRKIYETLVDRYL